MCLHAFLLAKFVNEQFGLDTGFDPIAVLSQLRLGEGGFLHVQELAELLHHRLVNFKLFVDFVVDDVVLGEIEERVFLQQSVLELIGFHRRYLHVGSDTAAAVHGAATVGHLDFVVGVIGVVVAIVVVVVVKRDAAVVALDQAAAWGVVLRRSQRQSGVLRQRIHGLHQTFAECSLTGNQAPVMVLNSASDNLRRRSRSAVYQYHQRIIFASVAMGGFVNLLRRSSSVMGNNDLPLFQELVSHAHALAQQSTGILAEVENQPVK